VHALRVVARRCPSFRDACKHTYHDFRMNVEEAAVTKSYVLSDVVAKIMYLSLTVAALVFVSMLLLAGVHL
jgi:hypothetical protein